MTCGLLALSALLVAASSDAQARRPNILLIVADDMGYADVGFQGARDIPTPNIDAIATAGIRFTDAYVSGPYCSQTRAGLLTGRYPQRFGHEYNIGFAEPHRDVGLNVGEVTLADRLHSAGYHTAIIGKWHLGSAPQFRPRARGFDEFYGFLGGGHSYVAQTPTNPVFDNDSLAAAVTYLTDDFTNRAVDFINRNRERPFFLYLAYNAVHVPPQAPPKYMGRFPNLSEPRRTYAAMLSAMDDGVGSVMRAVIGIPDADEVQLRRPSDALLDAIFLSKGKPAFGYRALQSDDGCSLMIISVDPVSRRADNYRGI